MCAAPRTGGERRSANSASDFVGERTVEERKKRSRLRRRQIPGRQDLERQVQPVARQISKVGIVILRRIGLVQVDQSCDVPSGRLGKSPGHRLPVPLHESECDDALQQDDWRDNDYKGAGVEAFRNEFTRPGAEPSEHHPRALTDEAPSSAYPVAGDVLAYGQYSTCSTWFVDRLAFLPSQASVGVKDVPLAADCLKINRVRRVNLDLPAQAIDLYVDCALVACGFVLCQFVPGNGTTGPQGELAQ